MMMLAQIYARRTFVGMIAAGVAAIAMTAVGAERVAEKEGAAKTTVSPAEAAVRKVVDQHIQGIVNADAELLSGVWDTDAGRTTFVSKNDDGKETTQISPIADSIKLWTAAKHSGTKGEIQSIDIVNDKMALAKARITWNNQVFDDYLVLLKTEGKWRLVSKTYTSGKSGGSPYAVGLLPK